MNESNKSALPGFPWKGKFEDKKEIDNYFSGDKIQCLLCGKRYQSLSLHLIRVHEISPDQYKEKYGLPWKRGLCGTMTSNKLSKNMIGRLKKGFRPPIEAAQRNSLNAKRRQDQPFLKKIKIENLECLNEVHRKYSDEDYQKVLRKMLRETKGLYEVCKDAEMPGIGMVHKYAKRNIDFRKALDRTYEKLPYSIQAGAGRLPEEQFRKDLVKLRQSGFSVAEMSRHLGVSKSMIQNRLNNMNR
jgi:hypothetical protein